MSTVFRLPELGENIEKGDLVKVLVSVGDVISKDQSVIELETEKATLEVPSSVEGRVESVLVKAGEQVKVGQVILTVDGKGSGTEAAGTSAAAKSAPVATEAPTNGSSAPSKPAEPASGAESSPAAAQAAPGAQGSGPTVEFKLPELGENIEKGDLLKVLVSVGDVIAKEQPVLELETEKATLEVPSSVAGRVKQIHVEAGQKVSVGQLILTLESAAGAGRAKPDQARPAAAQPAVQAPPAPAAPAKAPAVSAALQPGASAPPVAPSRSIEPALRAPEAVTEPVARPFVAAAPSVRRMARELGVDITQVPGSGPGGRISAEDIKAHVRNLNTGRAAPRSAVRPPLPLPDFARWGTVEREAMRAVRRATATRMAQAWTTVPRVTQYDKADITKLEILRKEYGQRAEARGAKPTVTAFALKVAASALKKFPQFAASLDIEREEIVYKKYCHIGVAVDTDRGLLVPVIRDVDRKNIVELSLELAAAAEKARNRKLAPEEMEGGVFTITNLGGIGGTAFSPIVNWPEVAILGISRSSFEPVYIDGLFQPRLMLPLSLSYDHRLIDGADAARFLRWVAEALEQPFLLPFEG